MKINWNKKYLSVSIYAFLVLLAASCCTFLFGIFVVNIGNIVKVLIELLNILFPIILGLCFAYIINPILKKLEKFLMSNVPRLGNRKKIVRIFSITIIYIFIVALIVIFLYIVIPEIIKALSSVLNNIPGYLEELERKTESISGESNIYSEIFSKLIAYTEQFFQHTYTFLANTLPKVYDVAKQITTWVLNIVIGFVVSIYFLANKELFFAQTRKVLYALFSKKTTASILSVTNSVHIIFSGFIAGKLINALLMGVICFICMSIFRFPYPVLISVLIGVSNIIPYFGPIFGDIPSALIIFMVDPIKAIFFIIFIFVLQQFDGNFLGPKILGQTIGLSPFWIIFAIILFGGWFGVLGMFIGVPIFAIIYSLARSIINNMLEKKRLSAPDVNVDCTETKSVQDINDV